MRKPPEAPNPRHRIQAMETLSRLPEDEIERMLVVLLHGEETLNKLVPLKPWRKGTPTDSTLEYALDLYLLEEQRAYIEASLICCDDNALIAKAFKFDEEEVQYYRHCFFDTSVFRNYAHTIHYIRTLPDESFGKQLISMGFHNGFGAIRYHFTPNKELVGEDEVLRTTMTDAYYRSQAHRGRPLTSKAAKESLKWAHTAIACSKMLLRDETPQQSAGDLKFKFVEGQKTTDIRNLEDAGIKVIH